MDNTLRTKLITTLCNIQLLSTTDGRDAWLLNLPSSVRSLITRRNTHCKTDLAFIFDAINLMQLKDGRWPILILIDALLDDTESLTIQQQLIELHREIRAFLEPPIELDFEPKFEEIVIGEDERLPISFLKNGLEAAKAVARITVERTLGGEIYGTAWLLAPGLLLTNHHVIKARFTGENNPNSQELEQQAKSAIIRFGYNNPDSYVEYTCLDLVSANQVLDYALLCITNNSTSGIALSDWGILKIAQNQPNLTRGTRLNVIQHPGGRVKEIAIRSNFCLGVVPQNSRIHYLSDTEGGSSGSPVMDDNWHVVGLHRGWNYYKKYYKEQPILFKSLGLQYATPNKYSEQAIATINEGVLIHAILEDLSISVKKEIYSAQGWA